jgi:hypothetical protein
MAENWDGLMAENRVDAVGLMGREQSRAIGCASAAILYPSAGSKNHSSKRNS